MLQDQLRGPIALPGGAGEQWRVGSKEEKGNNSPVIYIPEKVRCAHGDRETGMNRPLARIPSEQFKPQVKRLNPRTAAGVIFSVSNYLLVSHPDGRRCQQTSMISTSLLRIPSQTISEQACSHSARE
jgi:hypothetical protein